MLYHGVTTWKPEGPIDPNGIFPGRVGYVLFTKDVTVARLVGRPEGYMRRTAYETSPLAPNMTFVPHNTSEGPVHKPMGDNEYGKIRQRTQKKEVKPHVVVDFIPLKKATIHKGKGKAKK